MAKIPMPEFQAGKNVHQIRTPGEQKAAKLAEFSDAQLQCRAGGRHRWPSDEINPKASRLPEGMDVDITGRQGQYQITEECMRDCGRFRRYTTLAGGLFDRETRYSYWSREGNMAPVISQDAGYTITGRDCKGQLIENALPLLKAAARSAAS